MCSRASDGDAASRTSTPASRNPVAVSASVTTAVLYTDQFLPHPVPGQPQRLAAGDQTQVCDLIGLHRLIRDDDVDPQRIAQVECALRAVHLVIDGPLEGHRIV